jgi:hypothetical protein
LYGHLQELGQHLAAHTLDIFFQGVGGLNGVTAG